MWEHVVRNGDELLQNVVPPQATGKQTNFKSCTFYSSFTLRLSHPPEIAIFLHAKVATFTPLEIAIFLHAEVATFTPLSSPWPNRPRLWSSITLPRPRDLERVEISIKYDFNWVHRLLLIVQRKLIPALFLGWMVFPAHLAVREGKTIHPRKSAGINLLCTVKRSLCTQLKLYLMDIPTRSKSLGLGKVMEDQSLGRLGHGLDSGVNATTSA
jgi:hypothetical protein